MCFADQIKQIMSFNSIVIKFYINYKFNRKDKFN